MCPTTLRPGNIAGRVWVHSLRLAARLACYIHAKPWHLFRLGVNYFVDRWYWWYSGSMRCDGWLAQDTMGHSLESRRSKGLRMKVGIVELPEDLAGLDLAEGDLLLDVVEYH